MIQNIIKTLEAFESYKKNCQPAIREYCLDKSVHISIRFPVWEKYCDKKECYCLPDGEIGKLLDKISPYDDLCLDRYQTCTYDELIEKIYDEEDDNRELVISDNSFAHFPRHNEFLELIVEENLGSFQYDW